MKISIYQFSIKKKYQRHNNNVFKLEKKLLIPRWSRLYGKNQYHDRLETA